jgi:TonB family protein
MMYLPRAFSRIIILLAVNLSLAAYANSLPAQSPNSNQQGVAGAAKPIDEYAVKKVEPVYPPLARAAKVIGIVLVKVTSDEQGNVVSAEAVSGHPLLRDSAVDAARGWKFKPTGTRLEGTITVNFEIRNDTRDSGQATDSVPDSRARLLDRAREEVKENPNLPETHYRLGVALQRERKTEEAIAAFKQALQLRPDYPDAYQQLVQLYMSNRRFDDAVSIIRQRVGVAPGDAAAYNHLGQAYSALHKFDAAIDAYKQALQIKPPYDQSYQVYRDMGVAHVYLRQFDEAMDAINKSLELKPDDGITLRSLAWTYQVQGRYDEAIDTYQKALKSSPGDYYSIVNLAANYTAMGRLAEAEKQYREAIRVGPYSAQGYLGLAGVLSREQKLDEAEATLRQGAKVIPANVALRISLGTMLYERGKGEEALAETREALRLEPNNATALNNIGYYMVERNEKLEEALKMIQRAVDSAPNVPNFRDSLGWAYFKLGQLEEAEQYLAGSAKETSSPPIHEHLGDVYDKRGKKDLARAEWQRALSELQKGPAQGTDPGEAARLKTKLEGQH